MALNTVTRSTGVLRAVSICSAVAVLALAACASGSALVTGHTRDPISPTQVKIYLEPPAEFETIGLVRASSAAGWTQQESLDYAVEELKKQAAKLGANGVLLPGGKAIFVKAQQASGPASPPPSQRHHFFRDGDVPR